MRFLVSVPALDRVFHASVIVFGALLLSGCATYGSFDENEPGIEESLFGDFVGVVGGGARDEDQIDYSARAPLVAPPSDRALPSPREPLVAENNPQWPQGSRERVAQVLSSGDRTLVYTPGVDGVDIEATQALASRQSSATFGDEDQNRVLTPAEMQRESDIHYSREQAVVARQTQGGVRQRRFLTDPPVEVRRPSPEAPYGAEAVEAEQEQEGGIDWWPF